MADIKTVVTTYAEYIGTIEEGADVIRMKNLEWLYNQKKVWFAKGVCVTSVELKIVIKKTQVVLVVDTHADVATYEEATSVIEKCDKSTHNWAYFWYW